MHQFYICLCLLIIITGSTSAQSIGDEIKNLENDLKAFNYNEVLTRGAFLLEDPFLSRSDSLLIFTYMLNAAYALGNMTRTQEIMIDMLESDPDYKLDPRLNSPKIIEYFNTFRAEYLAGRQTTHTPDTAAVIMPPETPAVKPGHALSSLVLPGSGHLLRQKDTKSYFFTAASGILISGIIYSSLLTESHRDDYMKSSGDANYNKLYNRYNRVYKIRNSLITGYTIFTVYVLYDLLDQKPGTELQLNPAMNRSTPTLHFRIRW
jgi:hypothetical protein